MDDERNFLSYITEGVADIAPNTPTSVEEVDAMAQAVADVFSRGWDIYSSVQIR